MDNREIIIKAFEEAEQPLKAGEVAEATGVDKKEVGNIIKKLKDEAIISSPKRCYYEISK